MAKVSEVVRNSLSLLIVAGAEEPIEPVDSQLIIEELNDMMTEWDGTGISTGYTKVDSLDDTMTVADSILSAVKSNLAVRGAPHWLGNAEIPQLVIKKAADTFSALLLQTIDAPSMIFPATLPIGSAQTCNASSEYFPGEKTDELLTEEGGSLILNDTAE